MKRPAAAAGTVVLLGTALGLAAWAAPQEPAAGGAAVVPDHVVEFLDNHCWQCHRGKRAKGGLRVRALGDPAAAPAGWRRVRKQLTARTMPPKRVTPPTPAEYDRILRWLDGRLAAGTAAAPDDPGRVTLRRLNRAEYTNTVRDLLGVTFHADERFPADDVGYGFDNNGDVLTLPSILLEKYLAAAERIAREAIVDLDGDEPPRRQWAAGEIKRAGQGGVRRGQGNILAVNGEFHQSYVFPRPGRYVIEVRAYGQQAGDEPARAAFQIDGRRRHVVDVTAQRRNPGLYRWEFTATAGRHRVGFAFINDYWNPQAADPARRDRNLAVHHLAVIGPLDAQVVSGAQRRWLDSDARPSLAQATRRFLTAAYRRPATTEETAAVVTLARSAAGPGASLEAAFRVVVTAALVSPHFLFRVERLPQPGAPGVVQPLDDWAIATRLSYFLWSSMPDAALFAAARDGRLQDDTALGAEVDRMLRDPRASALAEHFATQWLQIRALDEAVPDAEVFPTYTPSLRDAMRRETELLFDAVLREHRPVTELLDAGFTFVNEELARHYGIPGVRGSHMRRVSLEGHGRRGILGHGSVLTATSNPTRTSPVRRGKWILEALLDSAPPPPPPGLDGLDESPKAVQGASLRVRLERHRADPKCAVCHDRMDTLGFALEPYDAVGRRRTHDGRFPVDTGGVLPDGTKVEGPAGLAQVLRADPAFVRSLAGHLFTYALGRGITEADQRALDKVTATVRADPTLRRLIHAVVRSAAFRSARGEAPAAEQEGKDF
jgi:hypothetical protein